VLTVAGLVVQFIAVWLRPLSRRQLEQGPLEQRPSERRPSEQRPEVRDA
jgi:hypothetical protein